MKETRKQKIARQQRYAAGRAADRAFDPIRAAIDSGELVIRPVSPEAREAQAIDSTPLVSDGDTTEVTHD